MDFAPPRPGDIVQCRFPQGKLPEPGPKQRPALVLEVGKCPDGTFDFTTTRCFEQIRVDVCYHRAPVIIVGTGAGLSYAELGPTHLLKVQPR